MGDITSLSMFPIRDKDNESPKAKPISLGENHLTMMTYWRVLRLSPPMPNIIRPISMTVVD